MILTETDCWNALRTADLVEDPEVTTRILGAVRRYATHTIEDGTLDWGDPLLRGARDLLRSCDERATDSLNKLLSGGG